MIDNVGRKSKEEGRPWSRLPPMDDQTKKLIKGKSDFFGLNYYTSGYSQPRTGFAGVSHWADQEVSGSSDPSWPVAKSTWLKSVPEGLHALLK